MSEREGCAGVPFELHTELDIPLYFFPLLSLHSPFF